jgi:DNA-binding transcriptional LysR family regulator
MLLGHAAAVVSDLAELTCGEAGSLRLAGFDTAWPTFLPAAVADFRRSRPGVRLDLEQLDPPAALRRLGAGEDRPRRDLPVRAR